MQKSGMYKEELQAFLPNVGDELMRKPTMCNTTLGLERPKPQPCIVEYVNREHLWYKVRFVETGLTECYKYPEILTKGMNMPNG